MAVRFLASTCRSIDFSMARVKANLRPRYCISVASRNRNAGRAGCATIRILAAGAPLAAELASLLRHDQPQPSAASAAIATRAEARRLIADLTRTEARQLLRATVRQIVVHGRAVVRVDLA